MGVQVRRATEHGPQSMDWQMLSYQNLVKMEGTRHQVAKVLVRGMCLWEGRSDPLQPRCRTAATPLCSLCKGELGSWASH